MCADGIPHESLVVRFRNPDLNFGMFRREFARIDERPVPEYRFEPCTYVCGAENSVPVDLSAVKYSENYGDAWSDMLTSARVPIEKFYYKFKRERNIVHGPVLQNDDGMLAGLRTQFMLKPVVIPFGKSVSIPVNSAANSVYFFGKVSMLNGWPISGERGEVVDGYTVCYSDVTSQQRKLKNGEDITAAAGVFGPSRINPIAANAPRALKISYDYDFERYFVNLLRLDTVSQSPISEICAWITAENCCFLRYGVMLA